MGGLKEPVRCMSYFPVVMKTQHVKEMREYIEKIHGKPLLEVTVEWINKHQHIVAHFHVMCIFMWHFHPDEYDWHLAGSTDKRTGSTTMFFDFE